MEMILAGIPCVESGNWGREFVVNNVPRAVMCRIHAFSYKDVDGLRIYAWHIATIASWPVAMS